MTTHCQRCGIPAQSASPLNPAARPLRRAKQGLCASCGATAVIKQFAGEDCHGHGPEALLAPHMQEQFARVLAAGSSDCRAAEIDWGKVVANWRLP